MTDHDSLISNFYMDENTEQSAPSSSAPVTGPEYTGPRTLDGRPAPEYARAPTTSSAKKPQKRTGIATLSSLSRRDEEDDGDDDDDEGRGPLFAGGEKSGLAVQDPSQRSSDPRRLINDIVAKAKANTRQSSEESAGPSRRRFWGPGQTLGGDGVESRRVEDPNAPGQSDEGPVQERVLHLWNDGFSIDDGPLRRYDDPQNRADLEMIRQGRAPIHLMNVRLDQRVDVKLQQHNENYRPPPKVYRPFSGQGRRLGSPVPGESTPIVPPPAATTGSSSTQAPSTGANASQPTVTIRIQLPDGTRLPAQFNTTQTVGDLYDFVSRASTSLSGRSWVISTTFPNKDHEDKSLVLGEMPEFKRGGTAVVKWK
ncbi:uncharacterized protein CTHT_0069140 [Thermochaetoides thermophila DSM 1495]|uniref:UBX domain-containing protein n=1 Tax=Chaetomium thermophilum (strain DSM 1495 / CBS 144.50 / IMI 039719) TaxID=759272 RepID=G0SH90_CHATD|nr:hypothetical protein CTHT_0069140 [Thermochaetoides thermophila DSM 1495]EGS17579.1 hypothetical protein CTHT_0069140 [Thermochaetoides thermophila DSM 1495]